MAQQFTSFTPIEEAEPQSPTTFTSFTPIEEEPAWTQNYVPRKTQGPARTVEGKTYPKTKPVVADTDYDTSSASYDELGLGVQPFREINKGNAGLMEGFKGKPPTVDAKANRAARIQSPSPESVMFTPAKNLDEVEAQISDYQTKFKNSAAAKKAALDKLRQDAAAEDYGVTSFLKDTGVDLTKGGLGLTEAYVGLLDITSGGAAGRVLGDMGYSPKAYNKFLNGFQSITRKSQDADVKDAQGFIGTLDALAVNPAALVGSIVESIPGTVTSGVAAGRYVRFLADRARP